MPLMDLLVTSACETIQAAAEAAASEVAASEVQADVSLDSSPTEERILSDVSSEHKSSLTADGLRKREPFQNS